MEFKDYYRSLGLPKTASDDEIKKAFRNLARKHHPDVAKDKAAAEEKFKEINEAYEVLGDPDKRRKYDTLGANWKQGFAPPPEGDMGGGFRSTRPGDAEEFHFHGTGFSDFFEQFFGGQDIHRGFSGFGRGGGYGGAATGPQRGGDVESDLLVTLQEALNGSVRQLSLRRIDGQSGQARTETFRVRIPAGATEGRLIRVPGKGGEGLNGGSPGDLFLRVRLARHPDFRVRGNDLYHDLLLAPWEAVLGTTVSVPTLEGQVSLRIPPGAQAGQQFRVRDRGLPGEGGVRGHLLAVINLATPERVSDAERANWEALARNSTFNPRRTP
ncbi:MAG TPA: J domain-containing protein [Verrucomicrobiales bacterium]|nr:J domain-containing protein [Verrucomicrobiales bacterium]